MLQSSRFFVHVVHESTEVDQIHHMAQLQMDYSKTDHHFRISNNYFTILLLYTGLHGEKNDGGLKIN